MNPVIVNILSEYGPLGAMVLLFAYVIISLDKRHQRALNRIESEKNAQILELKLEIKIFKESLTDLVAESYVTVRLNTTAMDKNTALLDEIRYLLKELLNKQLES